jgi:hypothetical protein
LYLGRRTPLLGFFQSYFIKAYVESTSRDDPVLSQLDARKTTRPTKFPDGVLRAVE